MQNDGEKVSGNYIEKFALNPFGQGDKNDCHGCAERCAMPISRQAGCC